MAKVISSLLLSLLYLIHCDARADLKLAKELPRVVEDREISQYLYLDNAFDCSDRNCAWGPIVLCPGNGFASAFELKYQEPGNLDETAINSIRLYCTENGHATGYIESNIGPNGNYYGMRICPEDYLTGFRGNVLENQGLIGEDVALEDFEADCGYGRYIVPSQISSLSHTNTEDSLKKFSEGEWSSYATCRDDLAICGLQTSIDDGFIEDSIGLADVILFCCDRNQTFTDYF